MTPLDAWVESVSGTTTTGLSVLASLEEAPRGLLFARAWLQWLGGLGVLVLALALIVTPGVSAKHMGFNPREVADVAGGTRAHARRVLVTYLALTLLGVGALVALGAGAFDATLHAFTSISTGGFASHDGSLAVFPGRVRACILVLCFAGAVPFSCYYRTIYQHPQRIFSDPQLRSLALLCALSAAALAGVQWLSADRAIPLGDLAATAVSAQTTAGFSSIEMSQLAPGSKLIVIASMFVGGGLGSTAGGIKIFRLLVCLRILRLLLDRISIVRSGRAILRFGGDPVSPDEVEWVVGVVSAYGILVGLSWLAFLTHGYAPLDSLFEVVSAVGTVGLSAGITSPGLPGFLKGVLSIDMLMGRVEVVAFIVLLRPATWLGRRRNS
jgi:trk system potassium uptake protein TrkH